MGRSRHSPGKKAAPERFEGVVRDVNSRGHGVVAHPDGRVFFVPGAWHGEEGSFEVVRLRGRSGDARIIELTHVSPARRKPPCVHHGFSDDHCGGCAWQFLEYDEQLAEKQRRVERAISGLSPALLVSEIRQSPSEFGYRNRAQLKTDGRRLGYQAAGSHRIIDVAECPVLNTHNQETLSGLRERLPQKAWRPSRRRGWSTLHIDDGIEATQIEPDQRRPFRQGNNEQNQYMQRWLLEQVAALTLKDVVLELFAGDGNFTEVLLEGGCESVCAIDSFAPAVDALAARQLPGVTAECVRLDQSATIDTLAGKLAQASLLLLDPPRDGLVNIADYVARASRLETVIYISCDLATYTRDVTMLVDRGFVLSALQPVDLFPQTPHVELLSVLRRPA